MTAYQFVQKNIGLYSVREMTGLFGVSRGAYYKWFKAGCPSRDKNPDVWLVDLIQEILLKHHRSTTVDTAFCEQESNQRFAHLLPVCENILNRNFLAEKP